MIGKLLRFVSILSVWLALSAAAAAADDYSGHAQDFPSLYERWGFYFTDPDFSDPDGSCEDEDENYEEDGEEPDEIDPDDAEEPDDGSVCQDEGLEDIDAVWL